MLGFFLPPTGVSTMAGMWRTPSGERLETGMPAFVRAVIYAGVAVALVAGSYVAVEMLVG